MDAGRYCGMVRGCLVHRNISDREIDVVEENYIGLRVSCTTGLQFGLILTPLAIAANLL